MKGAKFAMTFVMLVIFAVMVGVALQYPRESRFMPLLVGIPAIALCLLQLLLDLRASRRTVTLLPADAPGAPERMREIAQIAGREIDVGGANENSRAVTPEADAAELRRRELIVWSYFLGLVGAILIFGFLFAIPVFVIVFLRHWAQTSWWFALVLAAIASVALYMIFVQGLNVSLHQGFVTQYILERLVRG